MERAIRNATDYNDPGPTWLTDEELNSIGMTRREFVQHLWDNGLEPTPPAGFDMWGNQVQGPTQPMGASQMDIPGNAPQTSVPFFPPSSLGSIAQQQQQSNQQNKGDLQSMPNIQDPRFGAYFGQ